MGCGLFTVEDVARRLNITPRTLHYYEEIGLAEPTARTDGGHRLYGEDAIERLDHILRMKGNLGYCLKEIRAILDAENTIERLKLSYSQATDDEKARILNESVAVLQGLVGAIDDKLDKLNAMRQQFVERLERVTRARDELDQRSV